MKAGADAWGEVTQVLADDGASGDDFGFSVSISEDTLVVGAPGDDDLGTSSGSAYIFSRDRGGDNAWGQVAKLFTDDGVSRDEFGFTVAISGDTAVVGAPESNGAGTDSGSAYIFYRDEGGTDAWRQVTEIEANDAASFDRFGSAVAIDQDDLVVGSPNNDDRGSSSGSAYVYSRSQDGADAWGQVDKLLADDGSSSDLFGRAVSISGKLIVVGAPQNDETAFEAGAAYIFANGAASSGAWRQVANLLPSDGARGDEFGWSASIDNSAVAVGALFDNERVLDTGSAYVFDDLIFGDGFEL